MNRLGFVLGSRGLGNTLARTWQVATRFGLSAHRLEERLQAYAGLVAEYHSFPSLPITAAVLDRNPQVARALADRGVELCIHGLVHNDLTQLSRQGQREQIQSAAAIFRKHAIDFWGFRSPYLRYNDATMEAVEETGFEYDSNLPFYWGPLEALKDLSPGQKEGLQRGLDFYRPVSRSHGSSLPRLMHRLVEIPVSLPDDEILLDRMGLPVDRIAEVWLEISRTALQRQELFTVQLHPERFLLLEKPLRRVLDFARSQGSFWITTLREISTWWKQRMDHRVEILAAGPDSYRIAARPSPGVLLEALSPASGRRQVLAPGETISSPTRPVVGLHPQTSSSFRQRIKEMGYMFAISEESHAFSLYFSRDLADGEINRLIGECGHPLLLVGPWPAPYRAALAVTGDIDCLTLGDFLRRFQEG